MGLRPGTSSGRQAVDDRIDAELTWLVRQVTNEADWRMREQDLTRADLASLMRVSPGRVSQILSGGENLTLRTLATLAAALDARFDLQLKPHASVASESVAAGAADAGQHAAPDSYPTPVQEPGGLAKTSQFSTRR